MKHLDDGSVQLEGHDEIDLEKESRWVIEWLSDERYDGAYVFPPTHPMHAGYWMLPYKEPEAEAS